MRNTNIDLNSATQTILSLKSLYILEMCSVSINGERVWPAQDFQLIGYHFSYNN